MKQEETQLQKFSRRRNRVKMRLLGSLHLFRTDLCELTQKEADRVAKINFEIEKLLSTWDINYQKVKQQFVENERRKTTKIS